MASPSGCRACTFLQARTRKANELVLNAPRCSTLDLNSRAETRCNWGGLGGGGSGRAATSMVAAHTGGGGVSFWGLSLIIAGAAG